jgi:dihydrodipicolinate synthase/N-acetylneuraminate lyase
MTKKMRLSDPLWVPLLTHYRRSGQGVVVDADRMAAHVRAIQPAVRQFLLAGSTGDGWEISFDQFLQIVRLSRQTEVFGQCRLLFGALRPTTAEVVDWARALEHHLAEKGGPAGEFVGLAVCPPVEPDATQNSIRHHYEAILAGTTSPIAVYQLPQITGCRIAAETMQQLATHPRIAMFKDTSGEDTVAQSGGLDDVLLVRGAEGGYVDALRPTGPYDGWLLSTGNVFGALLRRMVELYQGGDGRRARHLSAVMTGLVEALFEASRDVPFGNVFSNANRAADHLCAAGRNWRDRDAPLTASGNTLPLELLAAAEDVLGHLPRFSERGYVS